MHTWSVHGLCSPGFHLRSSFSCLKNTLWYFLECRSAGRKMSFFQLNFWKGFSLGIDFEIGNSFLSAPWRCHSLSMASIVSLEAFGALTSCESLYQFWKIFVLFGFRFCPFSLLLWSSAHDTFQCIPPCLAFCVFYFHSGCFMTHFLVHWISVLPSLQLQLNRPLSCEFQLWYFCVSGF